MNDDEKILSLLQSSDEDNQKVGLKLYESIGSKNADQWFNGLDKIYEFAYGKKTESKDQLLDFFNETYLDLSCRNLSILPKSIGLLVNLKSLHLDNNQLTSIPSEIGALVNLETLWLYDNRLTYIPSEVRLLVNLAWLHLRNNPISKCHIEYLKNIIPKNCIIKY